MKYALIGCGRIAVNHVKAVINNNLDFIAACDTDLSNIDVLFEKTGLAESAAAPIDISKIARYSDYRVMIDKHPEIELAAIATPSGSHAEIALYLIDHGVNVIIEKPMAMSMKDADEIVRRAKEKGVTVCACHQNRFNKAVQEVKRAMDAGRFGKLSHGSVHVRWNRNKGYYDQAPWRGTWAEDGGCLFNQCIHGIDLLRWLMGGNVISVYGVTRQRQHPYLEAEDVGVAVVTFRNGAVATIEGTTNVYPKNLEETLYLFGERGTVKIGGTSTNNIDVWEFADEHEDDAARKGMKEATSNVYGNGHTDLYSDVIAAIKEGRAPLVDAVAGRDAVEMILSIYKSMKTGQPVTLPLEDFSSMDMKGIFR